MRTLYAITACAYLSMAQFSWAKGLETRYVTRSIVLQESPRISLKMTNVTLDELLKEVQLKTGIAILYRYEQVKDIDKVSINWNNQPVFKALEKLLREHNVGCNFKENTFVIARAEMLSKGQSGPLIEQQQQYPVTGYLYDNNGRPIRGASVSLLNTRVQASTDEKGFFQLMMPGKTGQLGFSYVGFQGKMIEVSSGQLVKVSLDQGAADIDEVVVTGYQEIKKDRMTGSVSTVKAADIEGKGFTSIDQVLIGRVSGLSGIQSGRPGEDVRIQIRGVNSLTGNTDPIWIVDGMPMQGNIPTIKNGATDLQNAIFTTGIGNLSPDDIESITVLKDAAASAIYGARAANGVIVVKTKSGTVGKTRFTASVNYGMKERPVNNISMMNSAQKIQFEKEIYQDINYRETGRVGEILRKRDLGLLSQKQASEILADLEQTNTDWFKEIFRTAQTQQYNFSMSGGTEKTQYYLSANHNNENGVQPNNNFKRSGMNIKLNHDPTHNLRVTANLGANLRNDRSTASVIDPLQYALYANPYEKNHNSDGSLWYDESFDMRESKLHPGLAWQKLNALDDMNRNTKTARYISSNVGLKVEYEIIPGLQFTTDGVYNINSNNNRVIEGANTYTNFRNNWYNFKTEVPLEYVRGSLREGTSYADMYSFRNTLSYIKNLNEKHFLNFMIGQEITQTDNYSSFNYSPVFDEDHRVIGFPELRGVDPLTINMSALGGTGKGLTKSSSFYANGSYSYRDKYILSGSLRYDGSDIIGNENQFTPLWNLSGRWNLHREDFLKSVSWLDEASLRASYGFTGSIDNNAFPFVVINYNNGYMYDGQVLPSSFRHANPNVRWQTKRDINIGGTFALFNRRVEIGVNYYHNNTRDVLDSRSLALSSGRSSAIENVADLLNKGWEFDLGLTLIKKIDFNWMVNGNIGINQNELSKTYYKRPSDLPLRTFGSSKTAIENYPAWSWFGYQFAGIDPANGHVLVHGQDGTLFDMELLRNVTLNLPVPEPTYFGKSIPPVYGGFGTTLSWKQFLFGANFEFKSGHMIPSFNTFETLSSRNRHINDLTHWRQPGDQTNVSEISSLNSAYGRYMYDVRLEKGDYLRASLMTVGYNLDKKLLKRLGLYTARLSVNARDLFTLTAYNGIDPSLMGSIGYPNSRSYTLSLNIGF